MPAGDSFGPKTLGHSVQTAGQCGQHIERGWCTLGAAANRTHGRDERETLCCIVAILMCILFLVQNPGDDLVLLVAASNRPDEQHNTCQASTQGNLNEHKVCVVSLASQSPRLGLNASTPDEVPRVYAHRQIQDTEKDELFTRPVSVSYSAAPAATSFTNIIIPALCVRWCPVFI